LFAFDNTYARELEGCFVRGQADKVPAPKLLKLNRGLAEELGLDAEALGSEIGAAIFSGNQPPAGADVLAQAYAGHQFGHLVPQLGDGRALLLGEVIDRKGQRRDIQLKGSGRTAFSRGGDGKAAVGPVLREYLIGEGMYGLGIPTTRALAAVATGQPVFRETPLPGAVLTRVAASHIRVGTFQFFAMRGDVAKTRQLADYTIRRHYPQLVAAAKPYLALLEAVIAAQASLIARWMQVGFIHGVMNTDNMAVSGETIDYGPCAFMDRYSAQTVFSSIDRQGRYAYGQQPQIARWNLARLAETLLPLIDEDEKTSVALATAAVDHFTDLYDAAWLEGMRAKLGLIDSKDAEDLVLANDFLASMEGQGVDFTLAFRSLSQAAQGKSAALEALYDDPTVVAGWLERWRERIARLEPQVGAEARAEAMDRVNPLYIPRNHQVEAALSAASERNDLKPFEALLVVLEKPFTERAGLEAYTQPGPRGDTGYRTFCGT
jgi:serine/tyrosine/threonine adenylyltransferase